MARCHGDGGGGGGVVRGGGVGRERVAGCAARRTAQRGELDELGGGGREADGKKEAEAGGADHAEHGDIVGWGADGDSEVEQ